MAMSLPTPHDDRVLSAASQLPEGNVFDAAPEQPRTVEAGCRPLPLRKRTLDVVSSALLLLTLSPLVAVLMLLIVIDSSGGPLFSQRRVGLGGREFRFYKLRTMVRDAEARQDELAALNEADGALFKIRRDPRVTRIGGFLRQTSLDELPQLWNVLRGDMSLVGPRPPLPREVATYTPTQARRLSVTPGMTGLWQVGGRSDLPFEAAIALDLDYIDTWSLALDLRLLVQTLLVVVRPRGAY